MIDDLIRERLQALEQRRIRQEKPIILCLCGKRETGELVTGLRIVSQRQGDPLPSDFLHVSHTTYYLNEWLKSQTEPIAGNLHVRRWKENEPFSSWEPS